MNQVTMERNMDIIRRILIGLEKQRSFVGYDVNFDDCDPETIKYHLYLLYQAGLIECTVSESEWGPREGKPSVTAINPWAITWEGQEFLASARNDKVWSKAKEDIKEKGRKLADIPFSILTALLVAILKENLGV